MNAQDINEIASVVDSVRRMSDYTIVSLHAHESSTSRNRCAAFIESFAHRMIEAGADVVVGHGPHVLRGIEIYQGKPIFYSLGSFIYQSDTIQELPAETYDLLGLGAENQVADVNEIKQAIFDFVRKPESWETVLTLPRWRSGILLDIKLFPISLGFRSKIAMRGQPMLAKGKLGSEIIRKLDALSRPYGTSIVFQKGVGTIRMSGGRDRHQ